MGTLERIFQAILFEVIALTSVILGLSILTNHNTVNLSWTMVLVATIAMLWNFGFNMVFDRFHTGSKENRTFSFRIYHVTLFQVGLILITTPVIAYFLDIGLVEAFIMDIGVTAFITVYAFLFNLTYDLLRFRFKTKFTL